MISKTQIRNTLEKLPEDFTLEQLIDRLIFLDKAETGLAQSEEGETISEAELDQEMTK